MGRALASRETIRLAEFSVLRTILVQELEVPVVKYAKELIPGIREQFRDQPNVQAGVSTTARPTSTAPFHGP